MAVRQMLHQRPHVGERCKLHDLWNDAFYERKTSNPASRMKLVSLMHGPASGECLPLKWRGKNPTLNLLTVC
jgi:hypothetical protein